MPKWGFLWPDAILYGHGVALGRWALHGREGIEKRPEVGGAEVGGGTEVGGDRGRRRQRGGGLSHGWASCPTIMASLAFQSCLNIGKLETKSVLSNPMNSARGLL